MRKTFLYLIALVIVAGFLLYMTTYTVRFTDAAVVSTFGRVSETGVVREPGMKFKWPAPIQSVTLYDTRARFMSTQSETQQTADDRQIVVESFLTWRVSDPLTFNMRFNRSGSAASDHYRSAEKLLADLLRSAMSEVSKYRLGELFTPKLGDSKLPALEQDVMARMKRGSTAPGGGGGADAAESVEAYGVEVMMVGIKKVVLPEATTNQVFERMRTTMQTLASRAESEGKAIATQIVSAAESDAKRIRAFAQLKADTIKNQGDLEAEKWLRAQAEDPELAEFLKKIEFVREGFGKKVMLVLPTSTFGIDLFDPASLKPLLEPRPAGRTTGMGGTSKSDPGERP